MEWGADEHYRYDVHFNPPLEKTYWRYDAEKLTRDGARVWGRSNRSSDTTDDSVGCDAGVWVLGEAKYRERMCREADADVSGAYKMKVGATMNALYEQYNNAIISGNDTEMKKLRESLYPQKLYRYRIFDSHWFTNIIKGKVYMGSPVNFNDPFDGNLYGFASSVYHSILNVPHKFPSVNFQIIDSHGETSTFKDLLLKRQSGFKDCFRVACFSERFDVMPMRALYAADHTGYVIEYDLEKMTIEQKNNLYKVAYLSKSDLQHIDNHIPRLPIYNLIQKDSEWSYELEWRMIKMRGSLEMEDLSL